MTIIFIPVKIMASFFYLIIIPGFIISNLLLGRLERHKLAIFSVGAGIAFMPIITFLYKIFFIPLNFITLNLIILILIFIFFLKNFKELKKLKFSFQKRYDFCKIILIIILFLGLFTRVYPVKDMNAPPFADPAVEGTIARLIVNNQGIPGTWEPFLDLELMHQTGFASIVAWFEIFSGVSIPRIILFLTNILHGLFPLAIYLLVSEFFKNKFRSYVASLLALLAAFPTYIFVAGMNSGVFMYFLLPFVLFLVFRNFFKFNYKEMALLVLISTSCFLIHPIYAFFLALFFFSFALLNLKMNKKYFKTVFLLLVFSVLIPSLFFLPKISQTFDPNYDVTNLAEEQWEIQSNYINPDRIFYSMIFIDPIFMNFSNLYGLWYIYFGNFFIKYFTTFVPGIFFSAVFLFSLYVILKERDKFGLIAIFWYVFLLFFGPIQTILHVNFPSWQYIYPTRVKFLTMIPLVVILSFGFIQTEKFDLKKNWKKIWRAFPLLLILVAYVPIGLWYMNVHLVQLSQRDGLSDLDLESIEWVKENTGKNSVILNAIGDVEAGAFVGGPGQWIPVLANRKVVFPATSLTENVGGLKDREVFMEYMKNGSVSSKEFLKLARGYGITHVFISENMFYSRRNFPKIKCSVFENSEHYELKFEKNGNCIFEVSYSSST